MSVTEDPGTGHWFTRIAQQLSVVTVIIIIAGGLLTCLLLFIFAKRQIMRFALRSHRGPHVAFGTDANKAMRKEILRRIDALPKITYEPKMLPLGADSQCGVNVGEDGIPKPKPCHYYRMLAMDDSKSLEQVIVTRKLGKKQSFESYRSYLMAALTPPVDPRIVHQFSDLYEAARFNPKPFNEEEYEVLSDLLRQLRTAILTLQPKSSIRSPAKSTMLVNKAAAVAALQEDNNFSKSAPYRRASKDKERKRRWSFQRSQTTDERSLCDSPTPPPPYEIITSSKVESTVV